MAYNPLEAIMSVLPLAQDENQLIDLLARHYPAPTPDFQPQILGPGGQMQTPFAPLNPGIGPALAGEQGRITTTNLPTQTRGEASTGAVGRALGGF